MRRGVVPRLAVSVVAFSALWLAAAPSASATTPGPNGKIAFVRTTATDLADIYSVNADGSGLTQITRTPDVAENHPAFSPDGNYIAFTRAEGSAEVLYIMRSDGTDVRFVRILFAISQLAWSPDGTKIAMHVAGNPPSIQTINTDGSGLTTLITDNGLSSGPSWSPDGTKLTFSRSNEIWTMNADGSGLTRVTTSSPGVGDSSPNWSPDGASIAFLSTRHCICAELYTVPSTGGQVTQLTNLGRPGKFDPIWSPDGTKIVFNWCTQGTQCDGDLYMVNADGSGLTQPQVTPAGERNADWQPAVGPPLPPLRDDLDKIAFASTRDHPGSTGRDDIFTINPDGSTIRPLTFSRALETDPAWSPTGSVIAFVADRGDIGFSETEDIYVMNPDGTGKTNLTNSGGGDAAREFDPAWSPDGSRIAYGRGLPTDIWVMNADGTGQTALTRGQGPTWSPDGTRIVFSRSGSIYVINPDGTGLTQLTNPGPDFFDFGPDYSPDGGKIAFSRDPQAGGSDIWVMNADGTDQHPLNQGNGASSPTWSSDGRRIAFSMVSGNPTIFDLFVMNADGTNPVNITNALGNDVEPDWRPVLGYPRPKGATPMRISLVPAALPCSAPNNTHGAPLSFGSCSPPQPASQYLTTGTPDANGRAVRMSSYLELKVIPGDLHITAHLNDVSNGDLTDYTGELRAHLPLRITDKGSPSGASVSPAATTQPFVFGFDIPCTGDAGSTEGSMCTLDTTADALVPGAIEENLRTVWQFGQVRVFDGGADGEGSTTVDNTVFATQGVFVP